MSTEVIHLSETGYHTGRRLCLARDGQSVHAVYAPLHKEEYRQKVCPACLKIYALEAYEDGDEMPDWVQKIRSEHQQAVID